MLCLPQTCVNNKNAQHLGLVKQVHMAGLVKGRYLVYNLCQMYVGTHIGTCTYRFFPSLTCLWGTHSPINTTILLILYNTCTITKASQTVMKRSIHWECTNMSIKGKKCKPVYREQGLSHSTIDHSHQWKHDHGMIIRSQLYTFHPLYWLYWCINITNDNRKFTVRIIWRL